MQLELRVLRYVIAVADEGGFQRAAGRLHLAQPALSRQIRDLERLLGVRLFERRPTRLTEPGKIFVESARELLAEAESLVERTRRTGRVHTVRLGYTVDAAFETVPRLLAAVPDREPNLRVDAREGWPPDLAHALRDRRLDLAISHGVEHAHGLSRALLRTEPLALLVAPDNPLTGRPGVRLRDLRGETFCLFARDLAPGLYDRLTDAARTTGETFKVWEHPLPGLRHSPLQGGEGFTLVPRSVVPHLRSGVVHVPLLDELPSVDLEILWYPDTLSQAGVLLLGTALATSRANGWTRMPS